MDVVSLAQFEVENSVATLGTATTRTHLQRLFRLAPEIVFCFDGDRAGRAAAWKAMQVALPEIQDGRQVAFLFLEEGEDPDTTVRSEGREGFMERVAQATSLPDFLFDSLVAQVDMGRMDGKARLVSLVKPLLQQLPEGALRDMMFARLSTLSGLTDTQLGANQRPGPSAPARRRRGNTGKIEEGQISPVALAISLVLQNPSLADSVNDPGVIRDLKIQGAEILARLVDLGAGQPDQTTARMLESFRDSKYHGYLEKLAVRPTYIDDEAMETHLTDTIKGLVEEEVEQRRLQLLEISRQQPLEPDEKQELAALLRARVDDSA